MLDEIISPFPAVQILKFQMERKLHPTLYNEYNYLSMLGWSQHMLAKVTLGCIYTGMHCNAERNEGQLFLILSPRPRSLAIVSPLFLGQNIMNFQDEW